MCVLFVCSSIGLILMSSVATVLVLVVVVICVSHFRIHTTEHVNISACVCDITEISFRLFVRCASHYRWLFREFRYMYNLRIKFLIDTVFVHTQSTIDGQQSIWKHQNEHIHWLSMVAHTERLSLKNLIAIEYAIDFIFAFRNFSLLYGNSNYVNNKKKFENIETVVW